MASLGKNEKKPKQLQQGVQTTMLGKTGIPAPVTAAPAAPVAGKTKPTMPSTAARDRGGKRNKK